MMIEPPGQFWSCGIFEIDDGVFVAVEQRIVKLLSSCVRHAGVSKVGGRMELVRHKAAEVCRRRRAIETMVVVQDSNFHQNTGYWETFQLSITSRRPREPTRR